MSYFLRFLDYPSQRGAPHLADQSNSAQNAQHQKPSLLMGSAPGARKSHLYLPRFACADRAKYARPLGKESDSALASPAGVGQGQGVFEHKHSQTIERHKTKQDRAVKYTFSISKC